MILPGMEEHLKKVHKITPDQIKFNLMVHTGLLHQALLVVSQDPGIFTLY